MEHENKNNNNNTIINSVIMTIRWFFELSGIYVMWIVLHYIAGILYSNYCTPNTVFGFLASPVLAAAPHCRAMRWVISTGGDIIINMWVIIGTWIAGKLCGNLLTNQAANKYKNVDI
jgi:hypothetical protein